MDAALVDEIGARVRRAIDAGERVEPAALQLLVRQYAASGRDDVGAALAAGLAAALNDDASDRADLLALCADAARVSDDPRLAETAAGLAAAIRGGWRQNGSIADAMRGIEACLLAADLAGTTGLVAAAVDELERLIAREYEPGDGLGAGALADQLHAAAALLTAYERTGRLPYAMLADELVQVARRRWWRPHGMFEAPEPFADNCEAARVCCRLAALHADADYCRAAVLAPQADYAADVGRVLAAQTDTARARGTHAAIYALALGDWLALRDELQ